MTAWNSPYFTRQELACRCGQCGGRADMNPVTVDRLTRLREAAGRPLTVSSGFRCERHPSEARKTTVGAHRQGRAVDLPVDGGTAYTLIRLALGLGFTGVGVSMGPHGPRFIHLDDVEPGNSAQPRPVFWSYHHAV